MDASANYHLPITIDYRYHWRLYDCYLLLFFPAAEGVVEAIDELGVLLIGSGGFEAGFEGFHIFADFGEAFRRGPFWGEGQWGR